MRLVDVPPSQGSLSPLSHLHIKMKILRASSPTLPCTGIVSLTAIVFFSSPHQM